MVMSELGKLVFAGALGLAAALAFLAGCEETESCESQCEDRDEDCREGCDGGDDRCLLNCDEKLHGCLIGCSQQ